MQGTLNSTEKTTQLLVNIVFKMYCIVFELTEIIVSNMFTSIRIFFPSL